jgi:hypothetical protein
MSRFSPVKRARGRAWLGAFRTVVRVSWQHINLLGEYDFSDVKLRDYGN